MKRIFLFFTALALCAPPALRAQDAAVEEQLTRLRNDLQDAQSAIVRLQKDNERLQRALDSIRELMNTANRNVASQDDVRHLQEKLTEVDRKRIQDNDKVLTQLESLGKLIATPPPPPPRTHARAPRDENPPPTGPADTDHFEYTVKKNDRLSLIIEAYQKKGVKVTMKEVVAANPGLDPNKLIPGKTLIIPAPKSQ